jgi:hypothetical protein
MYTVILASMRWRDETESEESKWWRDRKRQNLR